MSVKEKECRTTAFGRTYIPLSYRYSGKYIRSNGIFSAITSSKEPSM